MSTNKPKVKKSVKKAIRHYIPKEDKMETNPVQEVALKANPFNDILMGINKMACDHLSAAQEKLQINEAPEGDEAAYALHFFLQNMAKEAKDNLPPVKRNFIEKGVYGAGYIVGYPIQLAASALSMLPGASHFAEGYDDAQDKAKEHIMMAKHKAMIAGMAIKAKLSNDDKEQESHIPAPSPA